MRYDEFRDRLEEALQEAKVYVGGADRRIESIDIDNSVRRWKVFVWRAAPRSAEPFHVSAEMNFEWSPLDAARGYTCEEDVLTELVGRRKRPTRTELRWVRVDLILHASLPWGSTTPVPEPEVFGPWTASVAEKADAAFTDIKEQKGRVVAVLGGHQELEVETRCKPEGVLSLQGLSLTGFLIVPIPRVWDSPERREAEKDTGAELERLAHRFKTALDEWTASIAEVATWIRYSPPPPEAKPVEPWFEDFAEEEDDEEGGPGTTH